MSLCFHSSRRRNRAFRAHSFQSTCHDQNYALAQLFLHSLPADCFFNIVCFNSHTQPLFSPESRRYDDVTLAEARKLVRHLAAKSSCSGGKEIYAPLESVLKQRPMAGGPRQVFVLTDGEEVQNAAVCIRLVRRYRHSNRVFTLGIGEAADEFLLKGLARAGQGLAAFAASGESLVPEVLQQLRQALQPSLHDVCIDWGRCRGSGGGSIAAGITIGGVSGCMLAEVERGQQTPAHLPPIYDGTRLEVSNLNLISVDIRPLVST
jgi:hypothetical protein